MCPTPAPVIGATLAMMRSTSANARVTRREVRAAQAGTKGERTEHGAKRGTGRNAGRKANPRVDAVAHLQDRGDIGAGAEEGGVAE